MATQIATDRSLPEILKSLFDDFARLVHGELALLKSEVRDNVARMGTGAGLLGGAGIVGLFAVEFVLLAIVFGLVALGLQAWLAATVGGVFLGIVAAVLAACAKSAIRSSSLAPVETIRQVKYDAASVKDDIDHLVRKQ